MNTLEEQKLKREIARLQALMLTADPESAAVMRKRIKAKFSAIHGKPTRPKVKVPESRIPIMTVEEIVKSPEEFTQTTSIKRKTKKNEVNES